MTVYHDHERSYSEPRLFPYEAANAQQSGYVDFKQRPELIEHVLEDFKPCANTSAVQTFYNFLRWINGPSSHFETCDCALRPAAPHKDPNSSKRLSMHGRVFILFRDLRLNTYKQQSEWLCGQLMYLLNETDLEFTSGEGVVGFTRTTVMHTALSNEGVWRGDGLFEYGPDDLGHGHHLMLSFWAYGDTEEEVFTNLDRLFRNLWKASEVLSQQITESIRAQQQSAPPDSIS